MAGNQGTGNKQAKSYLEFVRGEPRITGKTLTWRVFSYITDKTSFRFYGNGQDHIGDIAYYNYWRKYVFYTRGAVLLDANCLREITEFLDRENAKRRRKRS